MTVKIGGVDFHVVPITAEPKLDDLRAHLRGLARPSTPIFHWSCVNQKGSDKDGVMQLALDCEVHVVVAAWSKKWGKIRVRKKASAALAKRVRKLTGLKPKAMREAVIKAIGPITATMDARPAIAKWGNDFSFDIALQISPTYFFLWPINGPKNVYITVGIPFWYRFHSINEDPCTKGHDVLDGHSSWFDSRKFSEQHKKWKSASDDLLINWMDRWHKTLKKRGAGGGIGVTPKDK